ncbi:hypothetical protein ACLOJK_003302 [Asimina triloba]
MPTPIILDCQGRFWAKRNLLDPTPALVEGYSDDDPPKNDYFEGLQTPSWKT